MDEKEKAPLQDEAKARREWRGDDQPPEINSGAHTLPASEDQDERFGAGAGGSEAPGGGLGTVSPPD